jgi:endonuclease YncB( thermonuclease family)
MFWRVFMILAGCCLSSLATAHPGGVTEEGCHRDSRTGERHCHPERAKNARKAAAYDSEHPPKAGDEGVFFGPFVRLVDGDTFEAKVQGVVMEFRLQGVDAPEPDQPYGTESSAMLRQLTRGPGEQLVLVFDDVDTYGRIVVQAWIGNLNINDEMVRRGAAWSDSVYARDDRLYQLEQEVRQRKEGLWALPAADRVEPWVWRKEKR